MRRILRWIVGLPIALLVIGFAVANRQWTKLSLDPFSSVDPIIYLNLPLWALFIVGAFIGILIGWGTCWLGQGKYRKQARDRAREISLLQSEIETSKSQPVSDQALTPYIGLTP